MNKQELIDRAVERFKGIWPDSTVFYIYHLPGNTGKYTPFWVACLQDDSYGTLCCTKDEFTKRARELGFINGYKYGVEYPTNGKKPDLPDDVIVQRKFGRIRDEFAKAKDRVGNFISWDSVTSFRICDERYKPKETAMSKQNTEQDNSWFEKGEFPKISLECEVIGEKGDDNYYPCTIVAYDVVDGKNVAVFRIPFYKGMKNYYSSCTAENFRPIKSERERFVEAGVETIGEYFNLGDALRRLYDAGCRFK